MQRCIPLVGFFRSIAKKALKLNSKADTTMDVGTGPGFLAIELAKLGGKEVKAVDIDPNVLKKASKFVKKEKVQLITVEASYYSMPFDDSSIDLLTSSNLIHMLDDAFLFFKDIKRILKPGAKGKVLVLSMTLTGS